MSPLLPVDYRHWASAAFAPAPSIRFVVLGSGAPVDEVRRAAELGRSEVMQTAQLLRKPMVVTVTGARDAAAARDLFAASTGVLATIIAGDASIAAEVLATNRPRKQQLITTVTGAVPTSCREGVFSLAPSVAQRSAAMNAWLETRPAGWHPSRNAAMASHDDGRRAIVVAWASTLVANGADSLNQRFRAAWDHAPDESEWLQWFAVKMVSEAAWRSAPTIESLGNTLKQNGFDGHKGRMLRFDSSGQLDQPLYVVSLNGIGTEPTVLFTWPGSANESANPTGCA